MPKCRAKARRRVSSLPSPLSRATVVKVWPSRMRAWAESMRTCSSQRLGVVPVWARKSLLRWRTLTPTWAAWTVLVFVESVLGRDSCECAVSGVVFAWGEIPQA